LVACLSNLFVLGLLKKKETKQLFYVLSLHPMWAADPDTALDKGQSRESQSGFVPFVMAPPG
jgi:hypothetical protein